MSKNCFGKENIFWTVIVPTEITSAWKQVAKNNDLYFIPFESTKNGRNFKTKFFF
jgi:predicted nuclease with TOPRIM domain